MTGNLPERIKGHRSERPWWIPQVVRVESAACLSRQFALRMEREQIQRLQPKYNERRWFRDETTAVYTLRVEREQLDQLAQIAAAEHRTLVQKLRRMIEQEIARHERPVAA